MQPKLLAILVEKMEEFLESDERCNSAEFYVGEETALLLAKGVEAVYDGMVDASKLEDENGK